MKFQKKNQKKTEKKRKKKNKRFVQLISFNLWEYSTWD